MDWIINNTEWIFSGVGVFIFSFFLIRNKNKVKQSQKGGSNSTNIQVGGDFNINDK